MPAINIDVINRSRFAHDADLRDMLPSLQSYIDDVVRRHWELDPIKLYFVGSMQPGNPGNWPVLLLDHSDVSDALGYHDLTAAGQPFGKVFLGDDIRDGLSISVTMTHELAELAVNPKVDKIVRIGPRGYAQEVADAVEADRYGVTVDRLLCSNIVLPAYFNPDAPGPYDVRGVLTANIAVPGLMPEGYAGYEVGGVWHDLMARHETTGRLGVRAMRRFGRRQRRIAPAAAGAAAAA